MKEIANFLWLILLVPLVLLFWLIGYILGNLFQGFVTGWERGRER